MPCVEFRDVCKSFGSNQVLRRISLSLPDLQTIAIVGESGSGKSTLLQHINGLLRPDEGEVRAFGAPIDYDELIVLRRRIGYAVQGVGLFPHLSVEDNITLPARLETWARDDREQRVTHLMALMSLPSELRSRFPHTLSGGQQQRAGLCRAMMLHPPLLLLDEPFSGVDPITRREIHDEFLALQQTEPQTVILVTHDMREAVRLAQHLVIMRDGIILQAGEQKTVLNQPADPYVARLLEEQLQ